ncbi:uncharacterized protein LOC142627504 [Castanea sativa]|uniref:uncharacterized protein LOC142627504 n=1 Tax=Castanea sativa TaxID=21020 RepID=UPI003F64A258
MIMSLCKKSVHSFFNLTTPLDTTMNDPHKLSYNQCHSQISSSSSSSSSSGGLGLITANDTQHSPNVLESSSIKATSSSPPSSPCSSPPPKKDPSGNSGFFLDDIGDGIVDGLMSCTESLGFESSDERRVEVDGNNDINGNDEGGVCSRRMRRSRMKFGEVKKFPPPLSSLNHNGRRSFFLRAVRKDGRLELTEVRLDRAETLCASREDGRLRLHLIQDCIEEEEQEEENLEVEQEEEQEKEMVEEETVEEEEEEGEEEKMVEGVEEDIEEERVEEWKFPVSGEGLRRCIEMASHDHHNQYHHHHHSNHHHNLNVWRQHCVTTG